MKFKFLIFFCTAYFYFLLFINFSCYKSGFNEIERELANSLQLASSNKSEILKVIEHYKKDSLKLRAAYFLIKNMASKGYFKYLLVDKTGKIYNIDFFSVKSTDAAKEINNYEAGNGQALFYVNSGFQNDIKNISASMLIENIDYAFKAWRLPWASHLTFDQFCELLLPYRIDKEPLQQWRKSCYNNTIKWVYDSMKGSVDVLKLCKIINDSIKKVYSYKHNQMLFPGTLTLKQISCFKGGRCEDLNMIAACWMRSVGVPIAFEFTPYWGNSNYGGHSWLSVFYNRRYLPFNPAYDNPSMDTLPFGGAHLAKTYRKKYSTQKNKLNNDLSDTANMFNFFKDSEIVDVTKEYLDVCNVTIDFKNSLFRVKYAYLGVLNGKYWQIVQYAPIVNNKADFKYMAKNVLYAPLYYEVRNNAPSLAGNAFLLHGDEKRQELTPDLNRKVTIYLKTKRINWLNPNEACHIVYWSGNDWIPIGKNQPFNSKKKENTFSNIPSNTIYRIINDTAVDKRESNYGRPFLFNREKHKFIDY